MALLTVVHAKVVATPNDGTSQVQSSDWNANHSISGVVSQETQTNKGTINAGTVTFDVSISSKQKVTVGGALSVAFSGWPTSGTYAEIEIQLVNGGVGVTWPTVNWLVGDGTTNTLFSSMGVTLANPGTNFVIVWSTDGGITLYGSAS